GRSGVLPDFRETTGGVAPASFLAVRAHGHAFPDRQGVLISRLTPARALTGTNLLIAERAIVLGGEHAFALVEWRLAEMRSLQRRILTRYHGQSPIGKTSTRVG